MIKLFAMIWLNLLRNSWSNLRWCKQRKEVSRDIVTVNDNNLRSVLSNINSHFDWTMDDWTQLFDSVCPAPYIYNRYLEAKENNTDFTGDCDDYHTVVYHILKNNGYDVALITLVTKPFTQSHTMCAIRDVDKNGRVSYRVVDYSQVKGPYSTLDSFVEDYSLPVRYWHLDRYNYEKNKFESVDKKEF